MTSPAVAGEVAAIASGTCGTDVPTLSASVPRPLSDKRSENKNRKQKGFGGFSPEGETFEKPALVAESELVAEENGNRRRAAEGADRRASKTIEGIEDSKSSWLSAVRTELVGAKKSRQGDQGLSRSPESPEPFKPRI